MIRNICIHAADLNSVGPGRGACCRGFLYARFRCDYLTRLDPIIRRCDDFNYIPMICGAMIENPGLTSVGLLEYCIAYDGNSFFFLEQGSDNPFLAYEHWLALHFYLGTDSC